ncbi:tripartite tricarboxylate transporter TctB family protein [Mailhella massiliensis]|uniref:Tripartite tricarboxylate transporter TctB family protein n=1 Tax=Mailhella massiliensis TaxID=1903261 RepID=A0A921AUP4_9BACT|nr:tripartite tricarboxylate transporter TctB family protein [Mailhella massiliensis]HJD96473.1 tripartite tricarboxylate transporter TctB family protein [Mailhella massiliensis]
MHTDRLTGLGFLVFSALLWFVIIPGQTEGPEEAFVPRLAVLVIAIPALIMLLRTPREKLPSTFDPATFLRVSMPAIALFLLYLISLACIGFFIPSFIFLVCALLLFGERRKKVFLFTPLVCLGGIYVIIVHFLQFTLPRGILF